MNIECTIGGISMIVIDTIDVSAQSLKILYINKTTKKMHLGYISWDSLGTLQLEVQKEVSPTVTKVDGTAI